MSLNIKLIIGTVYIVIISIGIYFLFSTIDVKDLMSYEFIKLNKDKFRTFVYHVGMRSDYITKLIKENCYSFFQKTLKI